MIQDAIVCIKNKIMLFLGEDKLESAPNLKDITQIFEKQVVNKLEKKDTCVQSK